MIKISQKIYDAWEQEFVKEKNPFYEHRALAAALRAAVDAVLPEHVNPVGDEHDDARNDQWMRIRYKFLSIVAELEETK